MYRVSSLDAMILRVHDRQIRKCTRPLLADLTPQGRAQPYRDMTRVAFSANRGAERDPIDQRRCPRRRSRPDGMRPSTPPSSAGGLVDMTTDIDPLRNLATAPGYDDTPARACRRGIFRLPLKPLSTRLGICVAISLVAAETAVDAMLQELAPHYALGVLYLVGVLVIATGWRSGLTAATTAASAVAINLLRSWPAIGEAFNQIQDWIELVAFSIVALVAHTLASSARASAAHAKQRRCQAELSREQLAVVAEQQATLRRVATLVANAADASGILPVVTDELARSLRLGNASLWRYESNGTVTLVTARDDPRQAQVMPVGSRWKVEGRCLATLVAQTGRPARIDDYSSANGNVAALVRLVGLNCCAAAPVIVRNRLWGMAVVGSATALPADTEHRVAEFTELIAIAIANAEHREALRASRARIVTAADDARRALERDLHDGAQQRMIALALQLRLIEAEIPHHFTSLKQRVAETVSGLNAASSDLQELARGIHPAILLRGGLGPALRELARRSTIPVTTDLDLPERLPGPAQVAAYYVVAEALTNACRHADAAQIEVSATISGSTLSLSVRDNGRGGADAAKGSGLTGLADRVEALGGQIKLDSPPNAGTSLRVDIPLSSSPGAPRVVTSGSLERTHC